MTLKMLSLFSGIGGIDLAAQWAGIETVAFCEIEPFCQKVLAKHWPGVPIFNDVTKLNTDGLRSRGIESVDIIAGGFPCQDISHAGKRTGIGGQRSGLWSEFYRLVCELRPRFVVVENVAALLNRGMGRVLGDLAAGGYDTEWDCLPAAAFGAPHFRERYFIVAYPNGFRFGNSTQHGTQQHSFFSASLSNLERFPLYDEPGRNSRRRFHLTQALAWASEPELVRVVDGVPARVDAPRLKGLGNAVVPQVVYPIFEAIVTHESHRAA